MTDHDEITAAMLVQFYPYYQSTPLNLFFPGLTWDVICSLSWKMITSEKKFFLAQFNIFLILLKSHVPFMKYSIFYVLNHCINIESCDVIMRISHNVEYIFEYIFWIVNHWIMKLGQLIVIVTGNNFITCFAWFGKLGPKSRLSLVYQPTTSKIQLWWDAVFYSVVVHWEWKIVNIIS